MSTDKHSPESSSKPFVTDIRSWLQSNPQIFEKFAEQIRTAQESTKRYVETVERLNKILRDYNWFYSFSLPHECYREIVVAHNDGDDTQNKINQVYVNYFSKDNFSALCTMVKEWNENPSFKPRMEIIRDCIQTLKNSKLGYNPSNVVLPALIAQIDGILNDFIKKHGFKFDRQSRKWLSFDNKTEDQKSAYKSISTELDIISDYPNFLLLDVLFQKALHGDELPNLPTFSRHKIMHGESIDYGKIENLIRAFLILDFLSYLE